MGKQGHNKGDKLSLGRFKEVTPIPATPPTSASPTMVKKKTATKAKKVSKPVDYSTWEPPDNLEETSKDLWDSMHGSHNDLNLDRYTRALAKKILPDLSDATDDEMLVLRKRLLEIARLGGGYRFSELEHIVRVESLIRGKSDLGEEGVSDMDTAIERLNESIRDQGGPYSAQGLFNVRLEGVQRELSDPTFWNVTVKVPSGYEIAVSKPDARGILMSMKIKPAPTKAYIPLWPKNEGSNQ